MYLLYKVPIYVHSGSADIKYESSNVTVGNSLGDSLNTSFPAGVYVYTYVYIKYKTIHYNNNYCVKLCRYDVKYCCLKSSG